LANTVSSNPNVTNPNNDVDEDGDENGLNDNNPAGNGITSGPITLTPGGEPSGNGNSNLTLDFGFVQLQPGITVDKQVAASPNVINATVTYTLRITNSGEITWTSLRVTDTLPSGITYAGNPSTPPVATAPEIVWVFPGPIFPNDVVTVNFEANVQTSITGTFTNTVVGTGIFTTGTVSDTDRVPLPVVDPSVQVIKTLVATSTGLITFNIRVINTGPSRLDTVPLFDQFIGPVEFLRSVPPETAFTNQTTSNSTGLIVWTDLTALNTPPYNAPHNLEPLEYFDITTVFSITTRNETFAMVNTATVRGAVDRFTNPANRDTDRVTVVGPTAIDLLYFEAAEQASSILVRWATAAEIDNFGFRLLRSKTGQLADAVQVAFVPAQGKAGGATYEYIDQDVALGETYSYWLVDVDTNGVETRRGPVTLTFSGTAGNSNSIIFLPIVVKQN
jgi:uncharacterized repeat protein (TIGR01451 family)